MGRSIVIFVGLIAFAVASYGHGVVKTGVDTRREVTPGPGYGATAEPVNSRRPGPHQ
jgi:hypothetical protein